MALTVSELVHYLLCLLERRADVELVLFILKNTVAICSLLYSHTERPDNVLMACVDVDASELLRVVEGDVVYSLDDLRDAEDMTILHLHLISLRDLTCSMLDHSSFLLDIVLLAYEELLLNDLLELNRLKSLTTCHLDEVLEGDELLSALLSTSCRA